MKEVERWNIEAVARTLGSTARPLNDPAAGEGVQIELPYARSTLELYPQTLVARYRSPSAFVELLDARLRVDGVVQVIAEDDKNRTVLNLYAPEGATTIAGPKPETEREQWVTVTGRVVGEPNLARTSSGKSYLYVLLAREVEGKVVEWHRVKFWNERAERIYTKLSRGGEVTVGGYLKEEERYDPRTRQTRTERYVHGVKVES